MPPLSFIQGQRSKSGDEIWRLRRPKIAQRTHTCPTSRTITLLFRIFRVSMSTYRCASDLTRSKTKVRPVEKKNKSLTDNFAPVVRFIMTNLKGLKYLSVWWKNCPCPARQFLEWGKCMRPEFRDPFRKISFLKIFVSEFFSHFEKMYPKGQSSPQWHCLPSGIRNNGPYW